MASKGRLFLIPNTLGSENIPDSIPAGIANRISGIRTIYVEHAKIARRLLIGLDLKNILDEVEMIPMLKGISGEDKQLAQDLLNSGKDIGIISDAGCPAVADPGNVLVSIAHSSGAQVIPLSGPSSILMGLMASGFNVQNFCFHGYMPKDVVKRKKKLKEIEKDVYKSAQTQIFIETPYRNQYLFDDVLSQCQKNTKICLAVDLSLDEEWIKVDTVENWSKNKPDINKKQCLFLMYK